MGPKKGGAKVDFSNPANLVQVLQMLSANDSSTIKTAEKALKPFLKEPSNAAMLMGVLGTCADGAVRHHAALLLRKKLNGFYPKYPATQQTMLKAELIRLILAEPESDVATAIAGAIASTASAAFEMGQQWPELFNLLVQLLAEPEERLRILTFKILGELAEMIPEHLKSHTSTIANLIMQGCQDPSTKVAVEAMESTSNYVRNLGNTREIMHLVPVMRPLFEVMARCLANHDEDLVCEGLSLIQECFELEEPLINDFVEDIVNFSLSIVNGNDIEQDLMESAGQTLIATMQHRPKLFAKKGMVAPTLSVLMGIVARSDPAAFEALYQLADKRDDDEDDDDEFNPEHSRQKMAQMIMDYMAIHVPSKYFMDIALNMISQGITSPDPQMRKAGCAALGIIAEGCGDNLRERLESIVPVLLNAFSDQEYYVRECACFAMGQFAEFMQPEILTFNQTILPVVFNALSEPRFTIQGHACYILENFCENLQPKTLRPFLTSLMTKLLELVQAEKSMTKEMALSAISSAAVAAESEFIPFTAATCQVLEPLLFLTEQKVFNIRGRALECWGHIAIAVGPEVFTPYFEVGMRSATQGVTMNDEDLKEHAFLYIVNSAKCMKGAFVPYLESIVPYMCEVAQESEVIKKGDDDDDDEDDEDAEPGVVEDDDFDPNDLHVNLTEGFINTKRAAVIALGALAEHTKEAYLPYLKASLESVMTEEIGSAYSLHEDIRAESFLTFPKFIKCALHGMGITSAPPAGQVLPIGEHVTKMLTASLVICLSAIEEDEDKPAVAAAIESLEAIMKEVGVVALHLSDNDERNPQVIIARIMNLILMLLAEKTTCQTSTDADAHDEEDDSENENAIMVATSDLITTLARLLRADFKVYFDEFHKYLIKFAKPNRTYSDRSMAIGCYADVLACLGTASLTYADSVMPIAQAGLADPMEGMRRNSAVCVGSLVESAGEALHPHYMLLLEWLHPLCVRQEKHRMSDNGGADVDNALAAVAKMINSAPTAVPLAQVLPALLHALPLSDDHQEGPGIYRCLVNLLMNNEPNAVALAPQIVAVLGETFTQHSSSIQETKGICISALREIIRNPAFTSIVQGYAATLVDPVDQEAFRVHILN
jgi:hypothetical protein